MITIECNYTALEFADANYEKAKKTWLPLEIVAYVFILPMIFTFIMANRSSETFSPWIILTGLFLAFIIIVLFTAIGLKPKNFVKKMIRTNPTLKDGVYYSFTFGDDEVTISEKISAHEGSSKTRYEAFKKVAVEKNYIYLYINKTAAYPIRISDVPKENLEELKKILDEKIAKK